MKFILISLASCVASSVCFSAQMATTPNQPAYITQDFQPISIQKQIQEYRLIYDEILLKNPENPYEQHSARLFSKLENAFKLIRKYIQEKKVLTPNGQEQKQGLYLGYLETLYQTALQLDKDQEMTPRHFERLNAICALIGTIYSFYNIENTSFYMGETFALWAGHWQSNQGGMAKDALSAGAEQTKDFIKTTMNNSLIGRFEKSLTRLNNHFFPLAILYMDKDIGIGYQTFVKQYFGPYPLFLATFFPSSLPTTEEEEHMSRLTKNDVHFSKVASPFMMLSHDFEHRSLAIRLFAHVQQINKNPHFWLEYLRPAYNLIKTASLREQRVLNAGLFLLIHEIQDGHIRIEKLLTFKSVNKFDLLEFIMCEFQNFTSNSLKERGSDTYKTKYRDNEYVLFWAKNSAGKPFVPVTKIATENKDRFLPMALDEYDAPLIILESDGHVVKVQSGQNTITIPYRVDAQNNLLLPKGWRFMTRDDRHVPKEHFHSTPEGDKLYKDSTQKYIDAQRSYDKQRKKKLALAHLRHPIAAQYIMKGFRDFFSEFKAIVEPAYIDMHKAMHSWL